jgi:hypothetical protein
VLLLLLDALVAAVIPRGAPGRGRREVAPVLLLLVGHGWCRRSGERRAMAGGVRAGEANSLATRQAMQKCDDDEATDTSGRARGRRQGKW